MRRRRAGFAWMVAAALPLFLSACGSDKSGTPESNVSSAGSSDSASALASASNSSEPDIKGEITWATHRTDLVDNGTFDRYVAEFKTKYPGITDVKIEGLKDYSQTIKVRMAGNEAPDVFSPPDEIKENYPALYASLDDLGLQGNLLLESNGTYEGHLYAVVSGATTNGLVYNKKAFAAAGLSGPPKTLDELFAAAEKLKAAGIVAMATDFKDAWPLTYWYDVEQFLANSSQFHNDVYNNDPPFTVDGPFGQAFGILKRLIDGKFVEPDIYSTDWEGSIKDIATGKAGMYMIGQWLLPQMADTGGGDPADFGFVPFPYDNSGSYKAVLSPDYSFAVNAKSKNIPAAKAWLKYLIEDSTYAEDTGMIPILKSKKTGIPQLIEFMTWNPTMITSEPALPNALKIEQKLQWDPSKFLQEAVVSKNLEAYFASFNQKYAAEKKALQP
ncbi:ABC transporter substrate-binding protein [Cohnella caldifontis]|uniref:ABC transporter substrate-binding protein n=1 Tax=Cohnella caldifontis TaxID=3027471 RepID=UPI0023EC2477|nr:extracellular solute-binding protein [Cohnella sp. YIM B05605]